MILTVVQDAVFFAGRLHGSVLVKWVPKVVDGNVSTRSRH